MRSAAWVGLRLFVVFWRDVKNDCEAQRYAGAIWTSDDFDEPLPEEFWTGEA